MRDFLFLEKKEMNKTLFIDSYLNRISKKNNISQDLAFEVFSISTILDISFDEVYDSVVIKGEDGGIDGIFFEEDYGNFTMHVFQCKNMKKLKQNQLDKFRNDFRDIFIDGNKAKKKNISGLNKSIEKYRDILKSGRFIDSKLYYIYNGEIDDESFTSNKNLTDNFHIEDEFEIWDSNDLYDKIKRLVNSLNKRKQIDFCFKPENSNITSKKDNQGLISFSIYQVKAAIFRIPAKQLCEMLNLEKNINGTFEKIFSENIRGFLGKKNLTNEKIYETIHSDKNVYFPFLNNGITIICNEFKLPYNPQLGNYNLPCKNPVIVNGLQTTYMLYSEYLKDSNILDDVYVTIRLYETEDQDLVELITDATNTQSAIGFRDKISNKGFNLYAKELFENKGIGYITKRGEIFVMDNIKFKKSIHNTSLLPLWYASFFESPHISLVMPKLMYKEIFQATNKENHPLNELFKGEVDSPLYSQLFFVYILREVFKEEYEKSQKESIDYEYSLKFENIYNAGVEYAVYFLYKLISFNLDGDLTSVTRDDVYKALYELVKIVSTERLNPNNYNSKSVFISSFININLLAKGEEDIKLYEQYAELFEGTGVQSGRIGLINSTYVGIEKLM